MLPKGDKRARDHVTKYWCHTNGYIIGGTNANYILDMRFYEGDFPSCEAIAVIANMIATYVYSI